jgi:NAD(P)-dependent dehydrogenase (short-subunit alcohol dehydrogenase family)
MTKQIAMEGGKHGIRCNTPLAVYLACEESTWVTGADFAIDGGTTAW